MKKNKILITVLAITVMLMVFAVPCFAYDTTSGQEYVFNEVLTFDNVPEGETTFNVSFDSNDVSFDRITITYRGYYVVSYHNNNLRICTPNECFVIVTDWVCRKDEELKEYNETEIQKILK